MTKKLNSKEGKKWVKSSISYTTYINVSTADGTPQNYTGTGID